MSRNMSSVAMRASLIAPSLDTPRSISQGLSQLPLAAVMSCVVHY